MYFVSILRSIPTGRYYVGSTGDIDARLSRHNAGCSRSTKAYRPWEIVCVETYATKSEALRRECFIKRLKSKVFIESLISSKR